MTKQITFVLERDAAGTTAAIFADIKAMQRVATVNLIWRHLAVAPAQLERAWQAARPIYASQQVPAFLDHFAERLPMLRTEPWTAAQVLRALSAASEVPALAATFATYNRGNAHNLLTLRALLVQPMALEPLDTGASARLLGVPASAVPPVPELDELAPFVVAKVMELNRLGADGAPQQVVATLYKHLAHWPGMLDLTLATLTPLARSGALLEAVRRTRAVADESAAGIAHLRTQLGDDDVGSGVRAKIALFTEHLICRLLPVGLTLQTALGHM